MPEFTTEIDIDPGEYLNSCSKTEIKNLIEYLVEDGHLPKSVLQQMNTDKNGKSKTSVLEDEFLDKMNKLSQRYHSITKDDEETLEKIFKKYL
jgi:hypothetical protein